MTHVRSGLEMPALPIPGDEWTSEQESQFRNMLENTLQRAAARISSLSETLADAEGTLSDFETRISALENAPAADKILLARVYFNGTDMSTSSTTFVDAHATNAAVSFTVPASGSVWVRVVASVRVDDVANETYLFNLRDGSGDITGTDEVMLRTPVTDALTVSGVIYNIRIDSLTPTSNLTWKLGHRVTNASMTGEIQSTDVPLIMEVYDGSDFGG